MVRQINNKGFIGIIAFFVLIIVFIIVLSVLGTPIFTLWQDAAVNSSLSGFELFIYDNPFLLIMIGLILGIIGWFYFAR